MASKISQNEINSLDERFSIGMFLADLPRVLNNAFGVVKRALNFYDATKDKIETDNAKFSRLESTTIITKNLSLQNNGENDTITYDTIANILDRLEKLEGKVN